MVQILIAQNFADLFQPEAFIDQIANHLHPPHRLNTVITITAGFGNPVRHNQAQ